MSFQTRMAGHIGDVFLNTSHFAESVTYTPQGEDASTVSALVEREDLNVSFEEDGEHEARQAGLLVSNEDVTAPARGDLFSFPEAWGGTPAVDWAVIEIQDEMGAWRLRVRRVTRTEYSPPDYRTGR